MVGHPQGVMSLLGRHSIDRPHCDHLYQSNKTTSTTFSSSIDFVDVSVDMEPYPGGRLPEIKADAHGQKRIQTVKAERDLIRRFESTLLLPEIGYNP